MKTINIFTAAEVAKIVRAGKPGMWGDGANLYIQIPRNSTRGYWLFLWRRGGRRRAVGLGPVHVVSLAQARQAALECARMVRDGRDPKIRGTTTFSAACEEYFAVQTEARRREWEPSIKLHCGKLADIAVAKITRQDVANVLRAFWTTQHSTATRVQLRLKNIFDWALSKKYCTENPALWEHHLEHDLPRIEHFPVAMRSLPYADIPAFVAKLRARQPDSAAEALLWTILNPCRMSNVTGVHAPRWTDMDFEERTWNVPKIKKMPEGSKPFPVPLATQSIDLLETIKARAVASEFVFGSNIYATKPIGERSVREMLHEFAPDADVHGLRATFKTYVDEELEVANDVAETCMMHRTAGAPIEILYRRGAFFKKRRRLMQAWADHCFGTSNVVDLGRSLAA
jgi:integrase